MKRTIEGHTYDTALATVIASHSSDSTHVHRVNTLYRSAEGQYFLVEEKEAHGVDGALLTPMTDPMARTWLENHAKADVAGELFKKGRIFLRVEIDGDLLHRIDDAAAEKGLSEQDWVVEAIQAVLDGRVSPADKDGAVH